MMGPAGDKPAVRIGAWGGTDVGLRRERNEDAYFVDDTLQLYIVADGMGGHVGGGLASKMAVATITDTIRQLAADPDATVDESGFSLQGTDPASILRFAVQSASRAIFRRSVKEPELKGMGTTAVVVWIRGTTAYVANVGDSRCYLMRRDKIRQVTIDHSLVGEQMRAGILSEQDARVHRLKNIITRSVGFQDVVEVDIEELSLRSQDRFLLCSDGLTNMVPNEALMEISLKHAPAQAGQRLIDVANESGGEDNITLVLVTVETMDASTDGTTQDEDDWDEETVQL